MPDPAPRAAAAFGLHDYEIAQRRSEALSEVRISSRFARPPGLGQVYTLDRVGECLDFVVTEVQSGSDGAWSARCRAVASE